MKLYNYMKLFGAFTNAYQLINLPVDPKDRQERKLVEEAIRMIEEAWPRRLRLLEGRRERNGIDFDLEAERAAFYPKILGDRQEIILQFVQDFMVRKIAAVQNNTSIHNTKEVKELREVFNDYGVQLISELQGLIFDRISWSSREGQKPKLMVHAVQEGDPVCIRFEAASELCQKFLNAILGLGVTRGIPFNLKVEAVDPAIERNAKAGKKVAEEGRFVNHNLYVTVGKTTHLGYPPKGERFIQKPTLEQMEQLFARARAASEVDYDEI